MINTFKTASNCRTTRSSMVELCLRCG